MFSKYIVPALAATNLVDAAVGGHRHLHNKKDVHYVATEVDWVTDYVTVTVFAGEEAAAAATSVTTVPQSFFAAAKPSTTTTSTSSTSTSTSSTSSVVVPATSSEAAPVTSATTLATVVQAAAPATTAAAATTDDTVGIAAVVATVAADVSSVVAAVAGTTTAKAATTTAASSSSSSSGSRRGLAYNDASLVSTVLAMASSKFGWAYNWGFTSDGLTSSIAYVPMLWGPTHYSSSWDTTAKAAIAAGSEALLSFNEPDNAGQANLSPSEAATYHQQYLNPYKGDISIGAPSITSSTTAGQGLSWLSEFFTACGGNCAYDFCNLHWYGPGGEAGADEFLAYLLTAQATCGKNVWVTEFAATSGDESAFMTRALDQLDSNSTFSFVDKYAYFYLATGSLLSSTSALSAIGEIYITA